MDDTKVPGTLSGQTGRNDAPELEQAQQTQQSQANSTPRPVQRPNPKSGRKPLFRT
jgi:hypothetical protein